MVKTKFCPLPEKPEIFTMSPSDSKITYIYVIKKHILKINTNVNLNKYLLISIINILVFETIFA